MRVKKVFSIFFKILVFLVFVTGLFIFVTVISTKGQGVPSFFGYSFLNVRTASMTPVYPVGTVVITQKTDPGALKVGDVISFYSQDPNIKGIPNTHRIYSVINNDSGEIYYTTKGDNNDIPDQYPVYGKDIIGVVKGSIHSLGKAINFFNSRMILFFIIILPLAVLMIFEAKNIGKVLKGKDNEPDSDKKNETPDISDISGTPKPLEGSETPDSPTTGP